MSNLWNKEQLVVALNLYWQVPYNNISARNPLIKAMAPIIGRSPAALAFKLMNFTSFDPERQQEGEKGKDGTSKLDKVVWEEYQGQWAKLEADSAWFLKEHFGLPLGDNLLDKEEDFLPITEKQRLVAQRMGQANFRRRILAAYNDTCCVTGLRMPQLLLASHIVPWSKNENERLNPRNGLCLNALHDKAFDKGLMTVTPDGTILFSKEILRKKLLGSTDFFSPYRNMKIRPPERFAPDPDLLDWHQKNIFTP